MPRVYLDTSLVFKYCLWRYFNDENVDRNLLEFLRRGLSGEFEIVISQLSISELATFLTNRTTRMLNVIIKQIQNSPDLSFVKLDEVSKDFFDEVSRYSKLSLSPADAMHVRIAQDVACSYFVTEDAQILKLSHKLEAKGLLDTGFKIVSIEEILQILNSQLESEDLVPAGKAFEDFIIDYFENHGYNVLIDTSKKDIKPDFVVERNGKKFAVETKLYLKSPVSSSEIERFLSSSRPRDIDGFWIVSPSGFSKGANKIAKNRPDEIKLLNARDYIKKIISETGENCTEPTETFLRNQD